MIDRLQHRGPDDRGVWCDPDAGLALANRRLAVVDLSPAGHQPMISASGNLVVAFNGEIFNYRELRDELERDGVRFRGRSDTEVLVEALARRGIQQTLPYLNGQFAIAIWNRAERSLTLVRDRFGEKPLYWSLQRGVLRFGSELKALRAASDFDSTRNAAALFDYLRLSYIPAPQTIYAAVQQLPPAGWLRIDAEGVVSQGTWWSAASVALDGMADPLPDDPDRALTLLEPALKRAVSLRRLADVPQGVFLSGGIDSSLVALLAQMDSAQPIRTFSIGFVERSHDESDAAAAVAACIGSQHTAFTVTAADAMAVIPSLTGIYDEPFADSSQIPTLLLARLARRDVTVALTGDGGDELFAGYTRHLWVESLADVRRRLPAPVRTVLASAVRMITPDVWDRLSGRPRLGERLYKGAAALSASPDLWQAGLSARWPDPSVLLGRPQTGLSATPDGPVTGLSALATLQLADLTGYLGSGVLTKVDRATMAASLEARAPFLDPDLLALAWRLPDRLRIRHGQGKWLLRRWLGRHLPPSVTDRPKAGFTVPLGEWLRGPLRDWAGEGLRAPQLTEAGLDLRPVQSLWQQHLDRRVDAAEPLWTVLMLAEWLRQPG
jgi:asparagine synthase (glutamine-hydrolysing)